jgi:hypothetical protein
MNSGRICGFGIVGAVAGAVLGAALLSGPAAYADDVATLPIPPFDPSQVGFELPGTAGAPTNWESSFFPYLYYGHQWDVPYTVADGSYEIQHNEDRYFGDPLSLFWSHSDKVIASDGIAPAVGTQWDGSYVELSNGLFASYFFENTSLTTSAGVADIFIPVQNWGWENDFYYGPAGTFDYLVNFYDGGVVPIFEFPADGAPTAAADFSTQWSDLVGAL